MGTGLIFKVMDATDFDALMKLGEGSYDKAVANHGADGYCGYQAASPWNIRTPETGGCVCFLHHASLFSDTWQ